MDISELLAFTVKNKASDLHVAAGEPPMIRIHGDMTRIKMPVLDNEEVNRLTFTMKIRHLLE